MPSVSPRPHFDHENGFAGQTVCGIDEAGRGPWAGPVSAAIVYIPPDQRASDWIQALQDSKLLKPAQRAALFEQITAHCSFGIGHATPAEIDELNILQANWLAMRRAAAALRDDFGMTADAVLVDGNLKPAGLGGEIVTLVKGDQISCSIAAASILAKVSRDRIMHDLCAQYPAYGFSKHAGYGTPQHRQALAEHGPCPVHRMSFRPVALYL